MRKLYIVDPQNDFMDTGSLPVSGSCQRMTDLALYLDLLDLEYYDQIMVSLDWHPLTHCSFAEQGGPWPQHCVSYTTGALVLPELMTALERWRRAGKLCFITKGSKVSVEEYSGVDDELNEAIVRQNCQDLDQLHICGVVGTVCVQNTIQGILDKKILQASKITVLAPYTAQFDKTSENKFMIWAIEQGLKYNTDKVSKPRRCLVFDTETGGLSCEDNDILQLSYQIIDMNTGETTKEVNHYFDWPEDASRVQAGAIEVNGLTRDFLAQQTLSDRYVALLQFFDDLSTCQAVVAHNFNFDYGFILAEARRARLDCDTDKWPRKFDTMLDTVDYCRLPSHSERSSYKWPRLYELANCLNIDYSHLHLHDSSADVELTAMCFRELCQRGIYTI